MEGEKESTAIDTTTRVESTQGTLSKKSSGKRRSNFAKIHADKLPVHITPLPAFVPHNPLSLLRIAHALISEIFFPPKSHGTIYHGYFDAPTRSIHVTDKAFVRGLWERGFFGKGSLSRSEPTWLHSEKTRLGLINVETSDRVTKARRKEREEMKKERARLESEAIELQRQKEANAGDGSLDGVIMEPKSQGPLSSDDTTTNGKDDSSEDRDGTPKQSDGVVLPETTGDTPIPETESTELAAQRIPSRANTMPDVNGDIEPVNQEHLQLSLEEAFFLVYSLGVLSIQFPHNIQPQPENTLTLLNLFRQYSYFPPAEQNILQPDDPFLLHYVVYHHFRSLGWVVRDGIKFAVDYLLYQRGPVFTHAEFAIIIVPSYTHSYWFEDNQRRAKVERERKKKSWWWLHCTNRLLNHVVKTLVLCYVDVPPPQRIMKYEERGDVGSVLMQYRVREFCVRRWSANRNR